MTDILALPQIWFYLFGAGIIVFALGVALSKNIVHCCMCMGITFMGVAAIYVLLEATFLAAVQVLIYVGAVTVLILFAILLSQKHLGGKPIPQHNSQSIPGAVLCAFIAWCIISAVTGVCCVGNSAYETVIPGGVREIGMALLTWYVVPFEIASLVLLVAMIGSIIIARRD